MRCIRFILMLPVVWLLSGCLVVKDFGMYWDSAKIDPALEGTWKSDRKGGLDLIFTPVSANLYEMQTGKEGGAKLVRTLDVQGNTYLMAKNDEDDLGGTLIPYIIQDGWLVFFVPDRDRAGEFAKAYPNGPFTISRNSIGLPKLTPETMQSLAEITAITQYWKQAQRYQR